MEQSYGKIRAAGLGLAAISYDSQAVLRSFAERDRITFPLLSDADSKVIRAFGLINETVDKGTPFYGIPYPGTFVVDANGVVTGKYFEDDYKVRDTATSILLRQFGIAPAEHAAVQAKHIRLVTSGPAEILHPGQRVSLLVDVDLAPRMHVYAPGVKGYIPIALTFPSATGYAAEPVQYPAAKEMRLEVIHETVPVYEGRFRLSAVVTLAGAKEIEAQLSPDRKLTIEGSFRYQACDDRECYVPETVPLRWTVEVQPFDRTRVPESLRRK